MGEVTKSKHITPYVRKKKRNTAQTALREHTQAIPKNSSLENVLTSSLLDASQKNAEMQTHSLSIKPSSPPHSFSQISSDIFMIDNMDISNSPSLKLMGEPKISIDTHHSEESDFLEYQSFISTMIVDLVLEQQKYLSQQSSIDITSTDAHPSMKKLSTDSEYPLVTLNRVICWSINLSFLL